MARNQLLDFGEASPMDLTHVMCRDTSITWEAQKILLAFITNHDK